MFRTLITTKYLQIESLRNLQHKKSLHNPESTYDATSLCTTLDGFTIVRTKNEKERIKITVCKKSPQLN